MAPTGVFVERVRNPQNYGVIEGIEVNNNLHRVVNIEEKPRFPKSNLAIVAIYVFSPSIHEAIKSINPKGNEIQLTDAIHYLIDQGYPVYGLELKRKEKRVDIGTPQSYWTVLKNMQKIVNRTSNKAITEKELTDVLKRLFTFSQRFSTVDRLKVKSLPRLTATLAILCLVG